MAEIIACKTCRLVHRVEELPRGMAASCSRCGARLAKHTNDSLHRTAALSLAALILFIPANLFPILQLDMYGMTTTNTVWQGCQRLYQDGDAPIAAVVFLASILIPLLKLAGLLFLVIASQIKTRRWRHIRTWIFRLIEGIGRWAMLDVFVLAILVSVVKLKQLATILPGPGIYAFTGVVVLTILASASFDPQLIWCDESDG